MKNRITRFILASLAIILLFGTVSAGAIVPYTSYTYDVSGSMQRSPHAYVPELQITTSTLKASVGENGNASIKKISENWPSVIQPVAFFMPTSVR